jgi:hypothetical protein
MIRLKTGLTLAAIVLAIGGAFFFKQLRHQSLNKENSFRARLIRFEVLPNAQLAICNLDDQTTLNRVRIKTAKTGWIDLPGFKALPPSGCGAFDGQGADFSDIVRFSALWEGELAARWSEELPIQTERPAR